MRACQRAAPAPPTTVSSSAAAVPTASRLRTMNLRIRYQALSGRASTGRIDRWRSMSPAIASTDAYRSSTGFFKAFATMVSRSPRSARLKAGLETTSLGRGASAARIASSSAARVSRFSRYGREPVNSSNSSTPSEYTSERVPTAWPAICSGEA